MNVIIAYLETMFSAYPATPRMTEAKAELLAMMEDAYAAARAAGMSENEAVGKVITDFGNLDELAPALGIDHELQPGTAAPTLAQPHTAPAPAQAPPQARPVLTADAAQAYAEARKATAPRLGLGVALIVAGVAPLVMLTTAGGLPGITMNSNVATFIGLMALVACVAAGVLTLVGRAQRLAPFSNIELGASVVTPDVRAWAADLAASHAHTRNTRLQIAVGIWILALAPILAVTVLPDGFAGLALGCSLLGVAAGLLVFLPANWAHGTHAILTADAVSVSPTEHSIVGVIASFYWPLVVAAYLAWSFIGSAWGTSWVIWPLAGVLFGALAAGTGAWEAYRKSRR